MIINELELQDIIDALQSFPTNPKIRVRYDADEKGEQLRELAKKLEQLRVSTSATIFRTYTYTIKPQQPQQP